jgi:HK97 family phage major capsid protein
MKRFINIPARGWALLALALVAGVAQAFGFEIQPEAAAGLAGAIFLTGEVDGTAVMKALDGVEANIKAMSEKATAEIAALGQVSKDTKTAIDNLGTQQRELADRLLQVEQKGAQQPDAPPADETLGAQFIKSTSFDSFQKSGGRIKVRADLKNTVTNAVANTFSQRRPEIVQAAFRVFTLEDLMTIIPTEADAIQWTRENVFTNAAAEVVEGGQRQQSSITFTPGVMAMSTVGHVIKITRQLAMDNAAMAAYINLRMEYGVNLRFENQLVIGNGATPNISGLANAGNYVPHGYTAASLAALGLKNNRFDVIGKTLGDCAAADSPADVIIVNTVDWWTRRLAKNDAGEYILGKPGENVVPMLFGLPVVASNAMPVGKFWAGPLRIASTLWRREGVAIDLSDSDGDNIHNGQVTVRAERRGALTVEKPYACRFGDLVPA